MKNWSVIIKRWLVEENFFQRETKDPVTNFHYLVETPPGSSRFVDIFQLKQQADGINLQHQLTIGDEHRRLWEKLPSKQAKDIEFELMMRLHHQRAFFQVTPSKKPGVWDNIMFIYRLFYEELTKTNLILSLDEINRNSVIIQLVLSFRLGVSPDAEPTYLI